MRRKLRNLIILVIFSSVVGFNIHMSSSARSNNVTLENIKAQAAPNEEEDPTVKECVQQNCIPLPHWCTFTCDGYPITVVLHTEI